LSVGEKPCRLSERLPLLACASIASDGVMGMNTMTDAYFVFQTSPADV
jgi:hypothetical protein